MSRASGKKNTLHILSGLIIALTTVLAPLASIAAPAVPRYEHTMPDISSEPFKQVLPYAYSTYAPQIDSIFNVILWITVVVFFLVEIGLVYFLWRYRHKAGRKAVYTHGNNKLEIAWTIVPAVILVFLAIFSNSLWSEIRDPARFPKDAPTIKIAPRQFEWDITYPGADGKFDTPDDISTINQLYLAVNQPVKIALHAQDVIHSFFVPEFRIKQDAVPGMETAVWITPTHTGDFNIACAELCGAQHYRMMGYIHVVTADSLANWLKSQAPAPPTPEAASAAVSDTSKTK